MLRVFIILVLFGWLPPASQAEDANRELHFIATHVPPYFIKNEQGFLTGIGPDILNTAAQECGVPIKISLSSWARALRIAEMNKVDAILPLAKTPKRTEQYIFSEKPIFTFEMAVFTKTQFKGKIDNNLSALHGKNVGTLRNIIVSPTFTKAQQNNLFTHDVRDSYALLAVAVARERLDAFVGERKMGNWGIRSQELSDEISANGESINTMPVYIAYSKNTNKVPQLKQFDKCLSAILTSDFLTKLHSSYSLETTFPKFKMNK